MPTPIAVAVVEQNDRFLVGQRPAGAALAGVWEFPGGKVEVGETPDTAATRECFEETGLAVEVIATYPGQSASYEHDQVQLHFFACRPRDPHLSPRAPFRWVSRDELGTLAFPSGNRELIQFLLNPPNPDLRTTLTPNQVTS